MKKAITLRLCIVIILSMFLTIFFSYCLEVRSAKDAMYENFLIRISKVSDIIERNDQETEHLKESVKEDYLIRAEAAAYIMQNQPEVIGDLEAMKKIASLLQVDELHLFNPEGTLFTGTEPEYYNYTFRSGEQMQYFLPMLDDYSLKLCQDLTQNTAENKLMQYIAVWREDHKGIVQIGMEPVRLLAVMEKNKLSHIFTMITAEKEITLFAADPDTGAILGTTDSVLDGRNVIDLGLKPGNTDGSVMEFTVKLGGRKYYYVVQQKGNVLIGAGSTYPYLFKNIKSNMTLIILSSFILSLIIIFLILLMLDKFIIHRIYDIIDGMKRIAAGDLDFRVEVTNTEEFVELSSGINHMVKSLLETTGKLSLVFENVNLQIAVYEYNQDMRRVLATSKIGDILGLSDPELSKVLSDQEIFFGRIKQIFSRPSPQEKDVYMIGEDPVRYVKIKSYQEERKTLGILVDITEEMIEKQVIKQERDIDFLTGLLSRRAYLVEMDRLFDAPGLLGVAGLLMTDLDNLKYVNDNWGHEYGDQLLVKAAELLKSCKGPYQVVSRLSGDEFVLLIYGASSKEEIRGYLNDLYIRIIEASIDVPGQNAIRVQMSGGYIFYPESAKDHNKLLRLADQTMYLVKKGTKGHFAEYKPEGWLV